MKEAGVDLQQLTILAGCNGIQSELHYHSESGLAEFRRHIASVSRRPSGRHMIVAYERAALGQTGAGHFSPVGGYHQGRDLALILDVARFKYPPHWTPVETLFDAMEAVDEETGKSRGYLLCEAGADRCSPDSCPDIDRSLRSL